MARKPKKTTAAEIAVPKTVTVHCGVEGGLMLRSFTMHDDGDGGEPRAIATGVLTLAYGSNPDLDAAFIAAWLNQNADSDVVKNGLVSVLSEGNS
ncbi:hypothetical protein [Bosea vaviloviae]|uniref:Uncharacterized protein n=1 Tax=Bosea vaviloviae TaxID=1526658 RepID=A0A0N1F2C6_9HYPH|nr:hypothetical protein [Bosea vaviloviae]KPH79329.1 hypothetical protein AE618_18665 [Bosea vaviloviae]